MARYAVKKGKYVDTYRAIRITPELYDLIRGEATRENITLLTAVTRIVDFYFDAEVQVDE